MKKERYALCVMGAWIIGSVFVSVVATQNFHTIDRLLAGSESTAFRAIVDELGAQRTRDVLRYLSSELNRLFFFWWNITQLALGVVVLWLVAARPQNGRLRAIVSAMLLVVVIMGVWLTPEITAIGRRLDFVPRDPAPPELGRFWMLHAVYTVLELAKLAVALVVASTIARSPHLTASEV